MDLALQAANAQGAMLARQCPVFVFHPRRMANGLGGSQCRLIFVKRYELSGDAS
jgi:hypothetical protein